MPSSANRFSTEEKHRLEVNCVVKTARWRGRDSHPERSFALSGVVSGTVLAIGLTLIFAVILSLVLTFSSVTEKHLPLIANAGGLISVAVGGAYAARLSESKGWLHGGITGVMFIIVTLIVGSVLFPGVPLALAVRRAAVAFAVGAIGGVVGVNI